MWIIAILKSHFNSYNPLISRDFFSIKGFSFIIMKKRGKKSREIIAGKFKCNFIKVLASLCLAWWVFSCQAWTRYKLMKYFFFFNSFISTSPSQPPILINFFFYSDCRHIVWNLQQKPKKTWKSNFFVYLPKEKQRIIIEDWSRVFRLKKNKKQNIFTIIFDYSVLPRSIYRKDIHFSLNSLNVFLYFMCDQ